MSTYALRPAAYSQIWPSLAGSQRVMSLLTEPHKDTRTLCPSDRCAVGAPLALIKP